ncbi:MAG: bifunctional heptose 7-phosphate kinase/heptose 1-phosphate adenyltransferase [Verrucomicrobiota bacterium]|jgi:rfaE bifunctional protein kinase chain/domain
MEDQLSRFRGLRVMVIGDIMLDRFIWGNVTRISPEAPVPVVHVVREDAYPGGAANVARNLAPFAGRVDVLGVTGAGLLTDQLLGLLEAGGIATDGILVSPEHETIVKTRIIARSQQMARIDRETIRPPSPETLARALAWFRAQLPETDAVILEDYAKGFLTQELVDVVLREAAAAGVPVSVDPNPGNPLRWHGATVIKPNRREAFAAAGLMDPGDVSEVELMKALVSLGEALFAKWETRMLLITLGEHGMALLEPGKPVYHTPTRAREVFDVSGAGDTAIALFTLALAAGASAPDAAELSNMASGIVVGKVGTATLSPDELLAACEK